MLLIDMNYHCEKNCRCAKDCKAPDLTTHPALLVFTVVRQLIRRLLIHWQVKSNGKAANANEPRDQNGCPAAMTWTVRLSAHVELLRGSAIQASVSDATPGRVVGIYYTI
jgi:hypothetical protein